MKKTIFTFLAATLLLAVFTSACRKGEKVLVVAAAASLTDAMKEISQAYGKENPDTEIQLTFAATGKLRTQIEKGAPVDVFASASASFGGAKDVSAILDTPSIKVMCYNCLVLAVSKKFSDKDIGSGPVKLIMSPKIKKLAVGTPEYVPAGKYAKLKMEELKIWKKATGKMIFANNVRQALAWLEAGEVDAAFIYRTDAFISQKVKIAAEFLTVKGKKIIYPAAITKRGKSNPESAAFEAFILSDKGQDILAKNGFIKAEAGGKH